MNLRGFDYLRELVMVFQYITLSQNRAQFESVLSFCQVSNELCVLVQVHYHRRHRRWQVLLATSVHRQALPGHARSDHWGAQNKDWWREESVTYVVYLLCLAV